MKTLGHAIRALRGDRSQVEVAAAAGIDATTWSFYETGRRRPKEANLEKILQGLGCSRLELEETAWQFLRRELLAEEAQQRESGDPRFVGSTLKVVERLHAQRQETSASRERRELRRLLSHMAILAEEVACVLTRKR